jgi:hypothetical protein
MDFPFLAPHIKFVLRVLRLPLRGSWGLRSSWLLRIAGWEFFVDVSGQLHLHGSLVTNWSLSSGPLVTYLLTYLLPYLLTYLLTPCSIALLEKLTGSQLIKNFPAFYGTRMFITAFKSPRHLSLSWASLIQSIPIHPTSWRFILILSTHLHQDLPSCLFPSGFRTKTLYTPLLSLHTRHMPSPS